MYKIDYPSFIALVDQEIDSQAKKVKDYESLYSPISYHFSKLGSRMIPKISYIFYKILDINIDIAVTITSSIELFHNFTIVHDDIIDKDKLRRGQKSIWYKSSPNKAIVIGDSIFILAIDELGKLVQIEDVRNKFHEILKKFTNYTLTICEGESLDIEFEDRIDIDLDQCLNMEMKKSGSTIGILLYLIAYCSYSYKSNKILPEVLEKIGINIGLSLQIINDVQNIENSESEQSDIINLKKSIPIILAIQHIKKGHLGEIENCIDHNLISQIIDQNKMTEKALTISLNYMNSALEMVKSLQISKNDFEIFTEYIHSFFGIKLLK